MFNFKHKLLRSKILGEELEFFHSNYKTTNEKEIDKINKNKRMFTNISIAGICIGFSLALSLRRYIPNQLGKLTLKRCLLESSFIIVGFSYFSKLATKLCLEDLIDIRKELLLLENEQYIVYLIAKYKQNSEYFQKDYDLVKDIMSEKDYNDFKAKSSFNLSNLFINNSIPNI